MDREAPLFITIFVLICCIAYLGVDGIKAEEKSYKRGFTDATQQRIDYEHGR